jgi:hypothetical protein
MAVSFLLMCIYTWKKGLAPKHCAFSNVFSLIPAPVLVLFSRFLALLLGVCFLFYYRVIFMEKMPRCAHVGVSHLFFVTLASIWLLLGCEQIKLSEVFVSL